MSAGNSLTMYIHLMTAISTGSLMSGDNDKQAINGSGSVSAVVMVMMTMMIMLTMTI